MIAADQAACGCSFARAACQFQGSRSWMRSPGDRRCGRARRRATPLDRCRGALRFRSALRSLPRARRRCRSRRRSSCGGRRQSRIHSAHVGQDVVVHYRWHPLYGRSARRIQSERRTTGEFVHVELTPGSVTILPAWKFDPVYCAGIKVGAPQVSLAALRDLYDLLRTCESRLHSADGTTVTEETPDALARNTEECTCSGDTTQAAGGTAATRSGTRRRKVGRPVRDRAPIGVASPGPSPAGSKRRRNRGGRS